MLWTGLSVPDSITAPDSINAPDPDHSNHFEFLLSSIHVKPPRKEGERERGGGGVISPEDLDFLVGTLFPFLSFPIIIFRGI
jgi:hypothetical protein